MDEFVFHCSGCGAELIADKEGIGKQGKCPVCRCMIIIAKDVNYLARQPATKKYHQRPNRGNPRIECIDNYTVIDLETTGLDPKQDAIIEVSALQVVNGKVQNTFLSLVNPTFEIPSLITCITGITDEMVAGMPEIQQLLPAIRDFIGDSILVGHNVCFDINFLYDRFTSAGFGPLSNDYVDTCSIARRVLPNLSTYRLKMVAEQLGIEELPTHRAHDDCISTMLCYEKIKHMIIGSEICFPKTSCPCHHQHKNISNIVPQTDHIDPNHPLYGKCIVFTGTMDIFRDDAMQLAVNCGAICKNSVTKETNYLVLGDLSYNPHLKGEKSRKQIQAEKYIIKGLDISIISESVFMDMIQFETLQLNGMH